MIRVFLVDDHEVVRRGLVDLLEADPDLTVVGEAGSCAQALARIPALRPDVAVLDMRLPDGSGVELCRELREKVPGLHTLFLTSYPDEQAMLDAVLAGAGGYVLKDVRGLDLIRAVRDVGAGKSMLTTGRPQPSWPGSVNVATTRDRWPASPTRSAPCCRCSARG
jgi:two-component system response regulator DevR